jgi:pimeloyl-ACP methyl ester carboxylesterase
MKTRWSFLSALALSISCWATAFAGQYVRVSPDLELYYDEAGTGRPLIFVTGWTGTGEFFAPYQISHFSKKYHVLAYDPRSHGRSSMTLEGHTYVQHGKDLRAFMEALKLKDAVLVGWSNGCDDVYGYFRTYGTDNISAFVCIDETPRQVPAQKGDWADFSDANEVGAFLNGVAYDRRGLMRELIPTMMQRKMTEEEIAWVMDQTQRTPNYVAVLLGADGSFADYTEEVRKVDGKIPVLFFLSEAKADAAKAWLAKNAPHSETFALGNHMMFREYPDKFNAALDAFLAKPETPSSK